MCFSPRAVKLATNLYAVFENMSNFYYPFKTNQHHPSSLSITLKLC